jgi:hypothetical protein
VTAAHPTDGMAAVAAEREWQTQRLPAHLRGWVDAWLQRTQHRPRAVRGTSSGQDGVV